MTSILDFDMSTISELVAYGCLVWSLFIFLVQAIGISRIFLYYSSPPEPAVSPTLDASSPSSTTTSTPTGNRHGRVRGATETPHITIIRPAKGLEPQLYECLASTFRQTYPRDKLTVHLCVSSRSDAAYPVLQRLVDDFPDFDARVLVEEEDPLLCEAAGGRADNLGPNPKIRNMSRGYREAKGDVIWIIDCNVWVDRGVAGRMVDKLMGWGPHGSLPYKFVHQLPLVVDVSAVSPSEHGLQPQPQPHEQHKVGSMMQKLGGRLDEMFMATTHAKFYSAINTVGLAPCIVGKSNMFRKSHLDRLTDETVSRQAPDPRPAQGRPGRPACRPSAKGIDYFSRYICEDHLIGDILWRSSSLPGGPLANHGLVLGDLAVQPVRDMSVGAFVARRVRWLRARKWTVILATLVEPGVESLLCNAYFAYAMTAIPALGLRTGLPQTWLTMALVWLAGVVLWMAADYITYARMHAGRSIEVDGDTPPFARGTDHEGDGVARRPFRDWLLAWVGREVLALPIWTWAVLLGTTVTWRGKSFRVRMDMRVVEIADRTDGARSSRKTNGAPDKRQSKTD